MGSSGLSLEAWLYFPQMPELVSFARAIADLTIILDHMGGLVGVGPYANRDDEVLDSWRNGIDIVSECPNIHVKLGGMGMPHVGFDWHTESEPVASEELANSMAPYVNYCIEKFGPQRCMFERNFPVDQSIVLV